MQTRARELTHFHFGSSSREKLFFAQNLTRLVSLSKRVAETINILRLPLTDISSKEALRLSAIGAARRASKWEREKEKRKLKSLINLGEDVARS